MGDAQKLIAIDLDGVLAEYSGWKGMDVIGEPREGARAFLEWLQAIGWESIIYTTRERSVVASWLREHSLSTYFTDGEPGKEVLRIAKTKPIATIYLDDRALRFEGDFASFSRSSMFRPLILSGLRSSDFL